MSTRSFNARIGHGRADVIIEYSADRDYDERGDFWDVDWDNVKVYLFEINIADALGDQLYILCGTILKHGLQDKIAEVFQEIQRSNMSKLDADGKPIYREDGKVMKSELYFKPNIKAILDK